MLILTLLLLPHNTFIKQAFYTEIDVKGGDGMGLILWIVLGGIAGWIASMITRSSQGILMDIILGIVGSIAGGFIMSFFGYPGVTGFNVYSLVVAIVGAAILIWVGRLLTRGDTRAFS